MGQDREVVPVGGAVAPNNDEDDVRDRAHDEEHRQQERASDDALYLE